MDHITPFRGDDAASDMPELESVSDSESEWSYQDCDCECPSKGSTRGAEDVSVLGCEASWPQHSRETATALSSDVANAQPEYVWSARNPTPALREMGHPDTLGPSPQALEEWRLSVNLARMPEDAQAQDCSVSSNPFSLFTTPLSADPEPGVVRKWYRELRAWEEQLERDTDIRRARLCARAYAGMHERMLREINLDIDRNFRLHNKDKYRSSAVHRTCSGCPAPCHGGEREKGIGAAKAKL
ncbi:unnamed protein product [Peniophora sp. CBMAI 1063]|nr:unnamed protein product [Peniophora sp. CBMAI 1063]